MPIRMRRTRRGWAMPGNRRSPPATRKTRACRLWTAGTRQARRATEGFIARRHRRLGRWRRNNNGRGGNDARRGNLHWFTAVLAGKTFARVGIRDFVVSAATRAVEFDRHGCSPGLRKAEIIRSRGTSAILMIAWITSPFAYDHLRDGSFGRTCAETSGTSPSSALCCRAIGAIGGFFTFGAITTASNTTTQPPTVA
jgi:hypothetical protein